MSKDKELENLLKLKQAIISDLKKKGKSIDNKDSHRRIELSSKFKERKERALTVDFSNVEIMRDIDSQDYDAPDFLVVDKLKKYLDNEKDTRKFEILTGLLKVLEFKNEEAINLFQKYAFNGDSKAAYNYAEILLFLGKYGEALKFISQFSRTFKADLYTYLSILEILIYFFKDWQKIEKVYNFFKASDDIFSRIVKVGYLIATSNFEDAYNEFTKTVVIGKYKNLLDIYSMVINKNLGNTDKALQTANVLLSTGKEHTCSVVHATYLKEQNYSFDLEKLNYCSYAKFLMAKKLYLSGDFKDALSYLEPLLSQNYPSALMLAGTIKMFQNDFEGADKYWLKLNELVPLEVLVGILKKPVRNSQEKLDDEIVEKNHLQVKSGMAATLSNILSSTANIGFKMVYPEIEYIKLFFGERTCKRIYSRR